MTADESSHTLATLSGIPVKVHYSYYAFVIAVISGCVLLASTAKAILVIQVLIGTFFAVLFHELGHAYVAHRLRHKVVDIMIYPIGGIATIILDRDRHSDVAKIAIAGPLVNIVIGCIFCIIPFEWSFNAGLINLFLGVGNLLPVKSFDGGLILHSTLSNIFNKNVANNILYKLTILIVCAITILGFYASSITICAIGLFVFVYGVLTCEEE